MKPVFQKSADNNDCFSACLASLLELELGDVPNFFNKALKKVADAEKKGKPATLHSFFWVMVDNWLAKRGLGMMRMAIVNDGRQLHAMFDGKFYCIVTLQSKSNKDESKFGAHSLVGVAANNSISIIHDPMPQCDKEKYNTRLYPFQSNIPGQIFEYAYFLAPKITHCKDKASAD